MKTPVLVGMIFLVSCGGHEGESSLSPAGLSNRNKCRLQFLEWNGYQGRPSLVTRSDDLNVDKLGIQIKLRIGVLGTVEQPVSPLVIVDGDIHECGVSDEVEVTLQEGNSLVRTVTFEQECLEDMFIVTVK